MAQEQPLKNLYDIIEFSEILAKMVNGRWMMEGTSDEDIEDIG